jgi:hypothetical protein
MFLCLVAPSCHAADRLFWPGPTNNVSAEISSTRIIPILRKIAAATGWHVFVEPGADHAVTVKFKNLPPGEALRLLLGDLSFALVPSSNSPARLFVFKTSRGNATEFVPPAKMSETAKEKLIKNELIVRLKPGANIDDLARLVGAKVVGRIDDLNAYRLRFENETAANLSRDLLAANPEVSDVDSNYTLERPEVPQNVTSSTPPPQLQLRPPPESGKIIIGLVDTSVQSLGELDKFVLKSISVAGTPSGDPTEPTHGTTMVGTILRALQAETKGATSVQILPVDVYGPNPTTSTFDVAAGIILARNNGAQIINLSLGSEADSSFLRDTVNEVNKTDVALFAAKGNQPTTTPFFPAALDGVTAVTATEQGHLAPYANLADIPTVGAPGRSVVSYNGLNFLSTGTSVASANVSGIAAGFMDANSKKVSEAKAYILNNMSIVRPK